MALRIECASDASGKTMPFKSKAQMRLLYERALKGEITKEQLKEFEKDTDFSSLPERAKGGKPSRKVNKVKRV